MGRKFRGMIGLLKYAARDWYQENSFPDESCLTMGFQDHFGVDWFVGVERELDVEKLCVAPESR